MASAEDTTRITIGQETLRDINQLQRDVAVLQSEVVTLSNLIDKLVTRPEFTPVKMLTYTLAGSTLAGVLTAILAQVIHK